FTIEKQSDFLADMEIWEPAEPHVFEKGHFHSYFEMLIFIKGGGTHQMGTDVFDVADHSVHILNNNTFHELRRTPEVDGFEIIFSDVFLNQLQSFDKRTNYIQYFSESRVLNFSEDQFNEFQIYFSELGKYQNNKSIFCNILSVIILKIITSGIEQNRSTSHVVFEKALRDLLQKHYKEKRNAEFYASKLNMSLNTFQRHTKQAFGKSIIELQNEKILHEVKFHLSQNDKPIKEISSAFNFSDESHFTHFFRKHIGISPSAYRKSSIG
ncbi:MAG TPA: AraC family transcriptional regulator, partial [Flavobacterium sp.]